MADKKKIIEMLQKLSAVANPDSGAFAGEMSNASAKIQELMDKHSITWAEVQAKEAEDQHREMKKEFTNKRSEYTFRGIKQWHWNLAGLIAYITHTKEYAKTGRVGGSPFGYMMFFGNPDNVEAAAELFAQWTILITDMANKAMKARKREMLRLFGDRPNFFASLPPEMQLTYYRSSWISGCISGMWTNVQRVEEERPPEVQNAIMLFKKDLSIAYEDFSKGFAKIGGGGSSGYSDAGYAAGKETGSSLSVGAKGIASGRKALGSG